jgi:N-methylhydantoinase A
MSVAPFTRMAIDVGGTFTDLVAEDEEGRFQIFKAPTTPHDPVRGMLNAIEVAAKQRGEPVPSLLKTVELLIHGTTRATNAIINGDTARTALLVTEGHPDMLLWREGTRVNTFDYGQANPEPYVSRALTFEIPERIGADGAIVKPLDEVATIATLEKIGKLHVDAVAVCLLWSVLNGAHEGRIGELIEAHLPGIPYTLSHVLTPTVREYRRASAASIDASLKPLMTDYLAGVAGELTKAGFGGRLLMMTSSGGVRDLEDVAATPIHSISSGPAAAPVAGRYYARLDLEVDTAVVTDAGGTSYDVGLVRRGVIPWTRETKLGVSPYGHITGFPSVDVKSIGAGGGSIAWVDAGGLLHVGPRSAGAVPGPACYGTGGTEPTITDACLIVGYLDENYFLGGRMQLQRQAAVDAVERHVAQPLRMQVEAAAAAILELQIEHMVGAIEAITLNQGVDPRSAVLVGGGGSAGFYSVAVARKLGCPKVLMPETAAALSAIGALFSDLSAEYLSTYPSTTSDFDFVRVNGTLARLRADCETFARSAEAVSVSHEITFSAEARYRDQIWELEVPLRTEVFRDAADVVRLRKDFDRVHEEILAHHDLGSDVEIVTWRARVNCRLRDSAIRPQPATFTIRPATRRPVYFKDSGRLDTAIIPLESLKPGRIIEGPAVIESSVTTIVVDPGATAVRTESGSIAIDPIARLARPVYEVSA